MAFDTKELEAQALRAIEQNKLFFIRDVVSFLPCSHQTFYTHELDKLDTIKEALYKNKTEVKVLLRNKWYKSDNPTVQISLYKLIADDEERKKLSQTYHDLSSGDKPLEQVVIYIPDNGRKNKKADE